MNHILKQTKTELIIIIKQLLKQISHKYMIMIALLKKNEAQSPNPNTKLRE